MEKMDTDRLFGVEIHSVVHSVVHIFSLSYRALANLLDFDVMTPSSTVFYHFSQ